MYYGKLPLLYSKQLVRNYKYIHKYIFKILETCDMSVSKEKSKYVSFNIYFYIELFFLRDLIKSKNGRYYRSLKCKQNKGYCYSCWNWINVNQNHTDYVEQNASFKTVWNHSLLLSVWKHAKLQIYEIII